MTITGKLGRARKSGHGTIQESLFQAAWSGDADGVAKALGNGASADCLDLAGNTALIYAATNGHANCVSLLLQQIPSNPDVRGLNGETALMVAIHGRQAACVDLLIPASSTKVRDDLGRNALDISAMTGFTVFARQLINQGADPKAQNDDGITALSHAAYSGNSDCVQLLLPSSDPNVRDSNGTNALMFAAMGGHADCVHLLLSASDHAACDNEGRNALMWAAYKGNEDCVRLLMSVSDLNALDEDRRDARAIASENGHHNIAAMIEEKTLFDAVLPTSASQGAERL